MVESNKMCFNRRQIDMRIYKYRPLAIICSLLLIINITVSCSIVTPTATPPITTTASTSTTTLPDTSTVAVIPPTTSEKTVTTTSPTGVYSNPKTYRAIRTITIKNETAKVASFRIWLPAATEWESQRNVSFGKTNPVTGAFWQDTQYGTKGLFFEIPNLPQAGTTLSITDEFTFTSYEIHCNISAVQARDYDKADAEYILNTQSQYFIEADDPGIASTANKLKGSQTSPYETARVFYGWVKEHMAYQLVGGLKGAKFAYENGYGECGDYSCLFVALCRASGIPARPVVGRWATSKKNDWHVWAEFYLPGYGWIPVDPTVEDSNGGNYFGHLDNKRLIFNKQCDAVLNPTPVLFPA